METNSQNMDVESSSLESSSGMRRSSDSVDSPTFGNMNASNANSLKLKIKLGANSTPTGTPRQKDSLRASNDYPFGGEDDDKPLKIFIKKSDLNSSGSQVPTLQGNTNLPPYNLTPIPIPVFTDISLLQKAASSTSDQFIEWKDQDVTSLRDELETVKKSLKDIGTNLQYQIDSLQMWKDNPYNVLYNNYVHTGNYTGAAQSPAEGTITKGRRGASSGKPQGKMKRKKMDDNWSSGAEGSV